MDPELPRLIAAICTYRRNDELARLLEGLEVAAARVADRCRVGVVVIDDTVERLAEPVATRFADRFALGVTYRVSGKQNISLGRNIGLETGVELGDWIAMTDDDCVPDPDWFVALLDVQAATGADAVSGRYVRSAPDGTPRWLTEQPFLDEGIHLFEDRSEMEIASTHNSMISAAWLRAHPGVRFDPDLGKLGGEDMVFYRTAREDGLGIRYARHAVIHEIQPPERCTYRYLVRNALWLGNSQYVTTVQSGRSTRVRMFLHGGREMQKALTRPVARLVRRQRPQLRFAFVTLVRATGVMLGAAGVRIAHH